MGYGPIPHSAIRDYCTLDADEFPIFLAVIRAMDGEWLKHANSDDSQPQESAEPLTPALFSSMFGK